MKNVQLMDDRALIVTDLFWHDLNVIDILVDIILGQKEQEYRVGHGEYVQGGWVQEKMAVGWKH